MDKRHGKRKHLPISKRCGERLEELKATNLFHTGIVLFVVRSLFRRLILKGFANQYLTVSATLAAEANGTHFFGDIAQHVSAVEPHEPTPISRV